MKTKVYSFGEEEEGAGDEHDRDHNHIHLGPSSSQPKLDALIHRSDTTTTKTPTIYSGPLPVRRDMATGSVLSGNPFLSLAARQTSVLRREATMQSEHYRNRHVQRRSHHKYSQDGSSPERLSSQFAPKKRPPRCPLLSWRAPEEGKVPLSISEAVATLNINSEAKAAPNVNANHVAEVNSSPNVAQDINDLHNVQEIVDKESSGMCYACKCPIQ